MFLWFWQKRKEYFFLLKQHKSFFSVPSPFVEKSLTSQLVPFKNDAGNLKNAPSPKNRSSWFFKEHMLNSNALVYPGNKTIIQENTNDNKLKYLIE